MIKTHVKNTAKITKKTVKILVFNAGSSSLKFEAFLHTPKKKEDFKSLYEGHFDNHGKAIHNFDEMMKKAVVSLKKNLIIRSVTDIKTVGHRVVHGGETYTKPVIISASVTKKIRELSRLAPLHNPANLSCIIAAQKIFAGAKHVAVFDTAFHHTMPEKAYLYGIPYNLYKNYGIRRYGFHGQSHAYLFDRARKKFGPAKTRRTITCHLGNGCSITAILDGKVIDTSMGLTPLEGLPMGTRSGDIDPAIPFFLIERGFSAQEVCEMLWKKSGLLGISGLSSDMRDLWAAYQGKKGAAMAKAASRTLNWFAYRIAKYIGAYTAALGGLDCIVFTGGIGENAWYLRRWIMDYVKKIAHPKMLIIKTDEERKIAEETMKII